MLISIGKDRKIRITDLGYQQSLSELAIENYDPECMEYDTENKRLFIASSAGELFHYLLTEKSPVLLRNIQFGSQSIIKGLTVDNSRNYVFACKGAII